MWLMYMPAATGLCVLVEAEVPRGALGDLLMKLDDFDTRGQGFSRRKKSYNYFY